MISFHLQLGNSGMDNIGMNMSYLVEGLEACTFYNISVKVNWDEGVASDIQTIEEETEAAGTCPWFFLNKLNVNQ